MELAELSFGQVQIDRIDSLFAEWDRTDSPGCAIGVVRNGILVYTRGYGMANLEHGIPISSQTVFRICSTSKQFTAVCMALLHEQGLVSLDDDIRRYIPELQDYGHTITIRHLIHHTNGLRDYLDCMLLAGLCEQDYASNSELLQMVVRQKSLNFAPGEEHLYSNTGYFLMAEIVARAGGQSLREYADQHVFRPLGMTHTLFGDDHNEVVLNRADGYTPRVGGGFRRDLYSLDEVGDGGLFTTIEDLVRWDQNFAENKLGHRGQALIDQILAPGVLNSGVEIDYAFGLYLGSYRGLKTVSHGGSGGGFRSELIRFPEVGLSVICLANVMNLYPEPLARQVAEICLEGRLGIKRADWLTTTTTGLYPFAGQEGCGRVS